jgi:hypothetical protein
LIAQDSVTPSAQVRVLLFFKSPFLFSGFQQLLFPVLLCSAGISRFK